MSMEQVKAFFAKVKDDSQLAQKLKDAEKAYTGDKSDKDAFIAAVFIPIAAQAGFNFTAEDFKAVFDKLEEGEASKDELNAVAGGRKDYCNHLGLDDHSSVIKLNGGPGRINVIVNC